MDVLLLEGSSRLMAANGGGDPTQMYLDIVLFVKQHK